MLIFTIILSCGCTNLISSVTLIEKKDCEVYGHPAICYKLEVKSKGIPTREVIIRAYHKENSKGAVIFTTGGPGNSYYLSYGKEALSTIETLYQNDLEIYEICWLGDYGWGTHADGFGYAKAVGAYTDLIKWMNNNIIDNTEFLFAQGNSGGSIQIAYGLALYGLDEYFDMVILTGGPPTSDLQRGIFGNDSDPARWPEGLFGFSVTDYLMGWENNGDYCKERIAPKEIHRELDNVSLVSPTQPRQYNYETKLNFINCDDPTAADHQGEIYYDKVSSEKYWHYIGNLTVHEIPSTKEGAEKIRELILLEIQ